MGVAVDEARHQHPVARINNLRIVRRGHAGRADLRIGGAPDQDIRRLRRVLRDIEQLPAPDHLHLFGHVENP